MKMVRPPLHAPAVSGLLDRLLRRWPTIAVTVLACLALAFVAELLLPQRYTSTATVTVAPLTDTPYGNAQPTQLVNMESERATVTSLAVCDAASRTVDPRPTARQLQESLDVVVPPQSLVLRISASAADGRRSADWANAVANAYLTDRTNTARDATARIAARLQSDIDARLRTRPTLSAPEKALVDREIASLRERQAQLSVVGLVPGRLVTTAQPAQTPSTMSTRGLLVGALAVGLLLGTLLALLQHRLDARIGSAAWIEETLGIPVRTVSAGSGDRHAQLVLGLLLGRRPEPARLLTVATAPVPEPTFGERVADLARAQGLEVTCDVQPAGASYPIETVATAHGDRNGFRGGSADGQGPTATRLHVTQWRGLAGQPWPIPPRTPGAILAVEVCPDDARRDLADLADAVRYLGAEVDVVVLRDDAPRRRRSAPPAQPGPQGPR